MMNKLSEMEVFLCVVHEGSFSAAGRKLSMSPSAVSKLIARIEKRLNVRLFERIAASIRLTQEGETFQQACLKVMSAITEAEAMMSSTEQEVSGMVRIYTALTTAKYLIAPHLPKLTRMHPNLRLEFVLGTERGDFVRQGLDIAILSGRPTEQTLVGKPLMPRPWTIAASPDYLQQHGSPRTPQDLQHHKCLNFTIRTQWNTWTFQDSQQIQTIDIPRYIGANQGELLRTLAIEGLGIVRLAQFHIEDDVRAGRLVPLLRDYQEKIEEDYFYLLYPKGRSLARRIMVVINFLTEHLKAGHEHRSSRGD